MKKFVALFLIFAFSVQISTSSYAQMDSKGRLAQCYNQMFEEAQILNSEIDSNFELNSTKRLDFLKILTYLTVSKIQFSDDMLFAKKLFAGSTLLLTGRVAIRATTRDFDFKTYQAAKQFLKTAKTNGIPKTLALSDKHTWLKSIADDIYNKLKSAKLYKDYYEVNAGFAVVVAAIILIAGYYVITEPKFSSAYKLNSILDLVNSESENEFYQLIMSDGDETVNALRAKLADDCWSLVHFNYSVTDFKPFNDQQLLKIQSWVENPF